MQALCTQDNPGVQHGILVAQIVAQFKLPVLAYGAQQVCSHVQNIKDNLQVSKKERQSLKWYLWVIQAYTEIPKL